MTIPFCMYPQCICIFFLCFFPGSNSSDWLRSVHGGDDFWSCWYSLVFQWLGGMWQMCLKGRTPCYHVRITPHSLWGLCASEPLITCGKHSQIRGALLTEAFCSLLGSGALWVSARILLEPIQIKRVMIHPVFAFLDWWALCFHWSSFEMETRDVRRRQSWGCQFSRAVTKPRTECRRWLWLWNSFEGHAAQTSCTHGRPTTPSLFLLCCLWCNSTQCNLQNWQH